MRQIGPERNWHIEEHLFDFPVCDSMLRPILPDVPIVPVAPFPFRWVQLCHVRLCIAEVYLCQALARDPGTVISADLGSSRTTGMRIRDFVNASTSLPLSG